MIASISGKIAIVAKDHLIIAVGGVGLQVFTTTDLCHNSHAGESIFLHTHLVVREDSLTLYGFETSEHCEMFILLLGVTGIGPRLSLNIVSLLSPDAIRRAVFNDQPEIFARVPGVGRKTAQKILLHLQDRLKPGLGDLERVAAMSDVDGEVMGALTTLGYSIVEAQAALQNIPRDTPQEVETRLRLALQYFSN